MSEAPATVLRAIEAIAEGRSVAEYEIADLIVEAAASAHPEAFTPQRASAAPSEPMVLAAIDADGSRWTAVSVRIFDGRFRQVVAAWTLDGSDLDVAEDDDLWLEAERSVIEPHLGVTDLVDPDDYPTWVDPCIGDALTGERLWADLFEIDADVGTVDAVLDDLLFPPDPADPDAVGYARCLTTPTLPPDRGPSLGPPTVSP